MSRNMVSICLVSTEAMKYEYEADAVESIIGRSGQGVHQENHVATQQVDARRQDLKARGSDHQQGDRRAC